MMHNVGQWCDLLPKSSAAGFYTRVRAQRETKTPASRYGVPPAGVVRAADRVRDLIASSTGPDSHCDGDRHRIGFSVRVCGRRTAVAAAVLPASDYRGRRRRRASAVPQRQPQRLRDAGPPKHCAEHDVPRRIRHLSPGIRGCVLRPGNRVDQPDRGQRLPVHASSQRLVVRSRPNRRRLVHRVPPKLTTQEREPPTGREGAAWHVRS